MSRTKAKSIKSTAAKFEEYEEAAARFVPTEDYAIRPFPEGFVNFTGSVIPLLEAHSDTKVFDVTAFVSERKPDLPDAAEANLLAHNQPSYESAISVGGLIVYWQGQTLNKNAETSPSPALGYDFTPDCLSFCVWKSRRQAQTAAATSAHQAASAMALENWYQNFAVEKYAIRPDYSEETLAVDLISSRVWVRDGEVV